MDLQQVNEIFQTKLNGLVKYLESQEQPKAFILGGQPASGKSKLANVIMVIFPNDKFFL